MAKPNIAIKDIESALKFRRAMKSFDASKKINKEDITLILEAIRLTPTSYGLEPFNVIVAQDTDFRKKLEKAAGVNAANFYRQNWRRIDEKRRSYRSYAA